MSTDTCYYLGDGKVTAAYHKRIEIVIYYYMIAYFESIFLMGCPRWQWLDFSVGNVLVVSYMFVLAVYCLAFISYFYAFT